MKTETIRCRDLMIGDWIADNNGFQWQITVVGDDYAYATFDGNECDPWEFDDKDDQPEPIPITPEILEKNGFEKYDMYHTLHLEQVRVEYYWYENRLEIQPYDREPWVKLSPIYSVHEFQHAFRLCGLGELADNFKV